MKTSRILIAAISLVAFTAGYLVRHFSDHASRSDGQTSSAQTSPDNQPSRSQSVEIEPDTTHPATNRQVVRSFNLTVGQLEAVLNMGMTDPVETFEEMGLSPSQIQKLGSIWPRHLEESIHPIELAHASVNEDEEGPYIEIEPFVAERSQWLSSVEEDVRKTVDTEQTPIISRAIIARGGLLNRGLFKRQIRFSRDSSGQLYSQESTFDTNGTIVREDHGKVFPNETNLWESLIQIPEK